MRKKTLLMYMDRLALLISYHPRTRAMKVTKQGECWTLTHLEKTGRMEKKCRTERLLEKDQLL